MGVAARTRAGFLALAGWLAVLAGGAVSAHAAPKTFVVPQTDGYGVDQCLLSGGRCGETVANAYCARNGFEKAVEVRPTATQGRAGGERCGPFSCATVTITCQ